MLRAQQPTATAPQRLQSACILAAAVTLLLLVVTHTHSGGGGQQQPADSSSSPGQTAGATAAAALDEPLGNRGSVDGGGEEEFHFRSMEDAAGQEHCPPKPIGGCLGGLGFLETGRRGWGGVPRVAVSSEGKASACSLRNTCAWEFMQQHGSHHGPSLGPCLLTQHACLLLLPPVLLPLCHHFHVVVAAAADNNPRALARRQGYQAAQDAVARASGQVPG